MKVSLRAKLPNEKVDHLPAFDFTKLSAINTCPRWGLIRYDKGLTFNTVSRSMALEAGSACHEFFAAVRLYQLGYVQGFTQHMAHHGKVLFGEERFSAMQIKLTSRLEHKTRS